jgi:hypothetical protein
MGSQHGGPPNQHGGTQCRRVLNPVLQVSDNEGINRVYGGHPKLICLGPQHDIQRYLAPDHHGVNPMPSS